jgi:hypothetical protein
VDANDLAQISQSLRQAVGSADDADAVRGAVADFGWYELLDDEAGAAVPVLFALQGERLSPVSLLDAVLVDAAGLQLVRDTRVVLPRAGLSEPTSRLAGREVVLDGVVQRGDGDLLVPCRQDGGKLVMVTCAEPATSAGAGRTLDPESGWAAVQGSSSVVDVVLDGEAAVAAWAQMSAAGCRALAHELVAVGGEMLRLALEHVTTREQFGQTLASFQAVKHKLADVRLWQEAAALSADAAWEDGGVESGALAKAAACRFSSSARQHCQQVLGGMGFTWEHAFHTYLRRALTLEPLLGSAAVQHRLLGEAMRDRSLPRDLAGL